MMGIVSSCLALFETEAKRLLREKKAREDLAHLKEVKQAKHRVLLSKQNAINERLNEIHKKHHGIPKSGPVAEEAKDLMRQLTDIRTKIEHIKKKVTMYTNTHTNVEQMHDDVEDEKIMQNVAENLKDLGYTDTLQLSLTKPSVQIFGQVNNHIKAQLKHSADMFADGEELPDSDEDIEEKLDDIELEMELDQKKEELRTKLNRAPPSHVIE